MLVHILMLVSACFSFGASSYGSTAKDEYTDLLNLLYEKYKLYKRDHILNRHGYEYNQYKDNKPYDSRTTKRNHVVKSHIGAQKTKDNRVTLDSINKRLTAVGTQDVQTFNNDAKSEKLTKRNHVVEVHVVTPVHDDDIEDDDAEKRGLVENLPKMDIITPVHDDDEDAAPKHIVPVHDDIDIDTITGHEFGRKGATMTSLPDDSKTFITVVEKNDEKKAKDEKKANDLYDKQRINNVNDDDDEDEDGNYETFHTDETFHIKNMNDQKEENVVEVDTRNKHREAYMDKFLTNEIEENELGLSNHNQNPNEVITTEVHTIAMPDVSPQYMDTYFCYAHKLPSDDRYIVEYRPLAEKQIAHHMLLFACGEPYQETGVWSCREMSPVCKGGGQSIMYAWAKNAPSLKMPTNVGFHVGGKSGFRYLVLQVHYLHVSRFKDGKTDNSGLRFVLDKVDKRYLAGIYLLADGFTPIPPRKKKAYIDMGCYYSDGPKFFPFRFRVHAHKLGVVITGYRVRNNTWTLIGRGDPQRPQAFYPVFHDIDIISGDKIMGRCTYNSTSRDTITYIGATHSDEMCNFYIMYFYDSHKYHGGEFPCEEVSSRKGSLFEKFPEDSDIALSTMEEANRLDFARYGVKDMAYVPVHDWPVDGLKDGDLPLTVGQISGVALTTDNTQVVIVHRADRYWGPNTFNGKNILQKNYHKPIEQNTLVWLDRKTGSIKKSKGNDMFYLPHGITIDEEQNIWITDVGSHQVYKLSPKLEVLLTLGQRFVPGSGNKRFCKPTDVAVMKNGDFFVADGYCNNRVVKFSSDGTMLLQISADRKPNIGIFPKPNYMSVVHSLALDDEHKRLFVADRENARIMIFNSVSGTYLTNIESPDGAVYAVAYNHKQGGILHFVTGPLSDNPVTLSGYTYSFVLNAIVSKWAPDRGFTLAHDLAVSIDNQDTFVAEINPYKIWKFTRKTKTRP